MTTARGLAMVERAALRLPQWRCPHCGWRLFDARLNLNDGEAISIMCRGCRRTVTFAGPQVDEPDYVA